MICHSCSARVDPNRIHLLSRLVASDCQPQHCALEVMTCVACGLVQKPNSAEWSQICEEIYSDYRIYYQAVGREQKARDVRRGTLAPRSDLLADFIKESGILATGGAVLDIGCGNGAFLRAFHRTFPHWGIVGADINESFRDDILAVAPGARFIGRHQLASNTDSFEVVALIHCLEHIPAPVAYLRQAKRHLSPGSVLLVQVPDAGVNPFDLVIADHASHFSKASLRHVLEEAGFKVVAFGNLVLGKEITALLSCTDERVAITPLSADTNFAERHLAWIGDLVSQAMSVSSRGPVGIFGSAIAGTWIGSHLGNRLAFFVDEDEDRVGHTNLGVPILRPSEVPNDATVLLALEPALAKDVSSRLASFGLKLISPRAAL